MKVILIHNIISPIRVYLFNKLENYYKNKDIDFEVIFLSETDKNRSWENFDIKFKYEIIPNIAVRTRGKDLFTFFINPNLTKILNNKNPDKIICFGWDHLAAYVSNHWANKRKREFILWTGSTEFEKSWRRTLFKPLVKYLIKNTKKFIAYGTRAKKYLISLGANNKNIKIFYNTVDIDYFKHKALSFTNDQKKSLLKKIGINTSKIILFSGQLIERKGIFELLKGFQFYKQKDSDVSLLIIGRGKEKRKMGKTIKKLKITNIFFTDFIQYNDLYQYYAISDLLILPSQEEVWGLVINEAMACKLPIITTNITGASADLIKKNKNGYIIKPNSPNSIAESISKVFTNKLHKKNNSFEIITKIEKENAQQMDKIFN